MKTQSNYDNIKLSVVQKGSQNGARTPLKIRIGIIFLIVGGCVREGLQHTSAAVILEMTGSSTFLTLLDCFRCFSCSSREASNVAMSPFVDTYGFSSFPAFSRGKWKLCWVVLWVSWLSLDFSCRRVVARASSCSICSSLMSSSEPIVARLEATTILSSMIVQCDPKATSDVQWMLGWRKWKRKRNSELCCRSEARRLF